MVPYTALMDQIDTSRFLKWRRPATAWEIWRVMSPIHPLVYFIRIGKFIKIGFTTDLEQRLAA